jgi:hypothetical protein
VFQTAGDDDLFSVIKVVNENCATFKFAIFKTNGYQQILVTTLYLNFWGRSENLNIFDCGFKSQKSHNILEVYSEHYHESTS